MLKTHSLMSLLPDLPFDNDSLIQTSQELPLTRSTTMYS